MKILFALLLGASTASAQILLSTDFESSPSGNYQAGSRVSGWYVAFGDVDVGPSSGSQALDLNGLGSGGVQRTLTTVPGQTYELSFDWTAGPDALDSSVVMAVNWNTETVAFMRLDVTPITDVGPFTVKRVIQGTGNDTVQFFSRNYGDAGVVIDNIQLSLLADNPPVSPLESDQGYNPAPIPEPSTYATLAALGLCGVAGFRRWKHRTVSV